MSIDVTTVLMWALVCVCDGSPGAVLVTVQQCLAITSGATASVLDGRPKFLNEYILFVTQ